MLTSITLILASFKIGQNDTNLARISKINNKLVFLWNEPLNDYETAFTFENLIPNYECLSPEKICIETIKNANIEAANQSKIYDAIVCVNGSPRDLAITWKDKTKDNAIARAKKQEGKIIFTECQPTTNYSVVGKYNVSGNGQRILLGSCPSHQSCIDKLLKKANKDKLDYDAVMYGSTKYDLVIKFK